MVAEATDSPSNHPETEDQQGIPPPVVIPEPHANPEQVNPQVEVNPQLEVNPQPEVIPQRMAKVKAPVWQDEQSWEDYLKDIKVMGGLKEMERHYPPDSQGQEFLLVNLVSRTSQTTISQSN